MMKKIICIVIFSIFININLYSQYVKYSVYEYSLGKHNILHYYANIREEPSINSNIIAILKLNDEIEILENSRKSEKINNVSAYWYKIKFGNIIGYTFGGNIAIKTFVHNNIFCYYRVSNMLYFDSDDDYKYMANILPNDIFIYVNKIRISNEVIEENYEQWHSCDFAQIGKYPIFILLYGYGVSGFDIYDDGTIYYGGTSY